jgi:antitoxin component YwqK of YwqJK toxin-antitoxin module
MKRILAPILLLTLLFPSLAIGETMKDLVKTDSLYYKKFTEVPFTGKTTGKIQGSFRNGKKHGPWVTYWDNGRLNYKGTYKNGKKDGPWVEYHKNGQLKEKGTFKNGKPDGPWVGNWNNGQIRTKGTHKDGKPDGPYVGYNKDGTVWEKYTGTFKDGVKVK